MKDEKPSQKTCAQFMCRNLSNLFAKEKKKTISAALCEKRTESHYVCADCSAISFVSVDRSEYFWFFSIEFHFHLNLLKTKIL